MRAAAAVWCAAGGAAWDLALACPHRTHLTSVKGVTAHESWEMHYLAGILSQKSVHRLAFLLLKLA